MKRREKAAFYSQTETGKGELFSPRAENEKKAGFFPEKNGKGLALWEYAPFVFFVVIMAAFCFLIAVTPFLAENGNSAAPMLYNLFGFLCHQLTSRSLCLFHSGGYYVASCVPSGEFSLSKNTEVLVDGVTGYKFPVCTRDVAIYFSMLLGGLLFPFFWKVGKTEWPSRWILLAGAIPIAIDGGMQLLGFWESSNLMRLVTGGIIGILLPFYIIPMLTIAANAVMKSAESSKR